MKNVNRILAILLASGALLAGLAQDKPKEEPTQTLERITTGEVRLYKNRHGVFRIYRTADDTRASVFYGSFESTADAREQLKQWLKATQGTIEKTEEKDQTGTVVRERIIATAPTRPQSKEKWFFIMRRDDVNCWLIESLSLPVAKQLEKQVLP